MDKIGPLKMRPEVAAFFERLQQEGGNPELMASVLLEMVVQMVRHGYITWSDHTLRCDTKQGEVVVKLENPRPKPPSAS